MYFQKLCIIFTVTRTTLCWRNLQSYCQEEAVGSEEGSRCGSQLTGGIALSSWRRILVLPGLSQAHDLPFCFPSHSIFTDATPLLLFSWGSQFCCDICVLDNAEPLLKLLMIRTVSGILSPQEWFISSWLERSIFLVLFSRCCSGDIPYHRFAAFSW